MDNILEEMKVPNLAEKNRKTFLEFLNSTNCEEPPYFLSTGLTTSFAHLAEKSTEWCNFYLYSFIFVNNLITIKLNIKNKNIFI